MVANVNQIIFERTSGSLNEGLPIKWPDKSFKENDIYYMETVLCQAHELSTQKAFHIGQALLEKYGLKSLFLLFDI